MRILLVDDDPIQLRGLTRLLEVHRPDLEVLHAGNGRDAVRLLAASEVELVLTDLRMPGMDGFELLTWMHSHQPHVPAFTMTGYNDPVAMERLRDLGVECFLKPLDVQVVLERLSDTLAQSIRGHVSNISLASLLQLVEMERKTCTLTVQAHGETGHLFIERGVVVDARVNDQEGDMAAISITSWASPSIAISNTCSTRRHTVQRPMGFIIMEAMRIRDEEQRDSQARISAVDLSDEADWSEEETATSSGDRKSLSQFPSPLPVGAEAIAAVEAGSGRIRTQAGSFSKLQQLARVAAEVYAAETMVLERLALDDGLKELVLTTPDYWVLLRPLRTTPESFVLLVFNPERANVVMERMELDSFINALKTWSEVHEISVG